MKWVSGDGVVGAGDGGAGVGGRLRGGGVTLKSCRIEIVSRHDFNGRLSLNLSSMPLNLSSMH